MHEVRVRDSVIEPFEIVEVTAEPAVHSTVEGQFFAEALDDGTGDLRQGETVSEEVAKKELIRQAMSELGKRSAAARAKKKSDIQE